ncbi:MAG: restriction endonuclease [Anaerolineae bacterium]|nr:restriction endonuclease [Anaerolineae bacterium]
MDALPVLNVGLLKQEVGAYARTIGARNIASLYGVTDGKAIGTFIEQDIRGHLSSRYRFAAGNAASGIDFPELNVDLKVTSIRQPQSSCPFRDADQKIYGLGYALLVIAYDKTDDPTERAARLTAKHVIFIEAERTGDYQTTFGILEILRRDGNTDDIDAFLEERNLPIDEIGRARLARRVVATPPLLGYLTVSNALQWRLQYGRAITLAAEDSVTGLENLLA